MLQKGLSVSIPLLDYVPKTSLKGGLSLIQCVNLQQIMDASPTLSLLPHTFQSSYHSLLHPPPYAHMVQHCKSRASTAHLLYCGHALQQYCTDLFLACFRFIEFISTAQYATGFLRSTLYYNDLKQIAASPCTWKSKSYMPINLPAVH